MWLSLLVACTRAISPALEVAPTALVAPAPPASDPSARLEWILAGDPLVRRPRVPEAEISLIPFLQVQSGTATADEWWVLEREHPGTVLVPFARGARLAVLETSLGDTPIALDHAIPLVRASVALPPGARGPADWVGGVDALLAVVERSVLLGWLDGPGIDSTPASRLLNRPEWARLAENEIGRLLVARAARHSDPVAASRGAADLADATTLALQAAAARSAAERAAVAVRLEAVRNQLGGAANPIGALLSRAIPALTGDAGNDTSAGFALVAIAAQRWGDECATPPCGGLDRTESWNAAARWGPEPERVARLWQLIALDGARDHLDAAWQRATFPDALVGIVDVLIGLGDPAFDRSLLSRVQPDAAICLAISRAVRAPDATTREGLFEALDTTIRARARASLPTATPAEAPFLQGLLR